MNTFENKIDRWILHNPYIISLIQKYESKVSAEKDFAFTKENMFEFYKEILAYNNISDNGVLNILKVFENDIPVFDLTKESLFENHIFFILNWHDIETV